MQVTVKSTKEIAHINGAPARAWVGETDLGEPVVVYITHLAAVDPCRHPAELEELNTNPVAKAKAAANA